MAVEVTVSEHGWCLAGDLDASCNGELTAAFSRLPDLDGTAVEVDLRAVSFIDSSGLGQLIELANRVRRHGGSLVVRNPSRAVHRLLSITELTELFGLDAAP